MAVVLAGDIGGTKTHLGLYQVDRGAPQAQRDRIYPTAGFGSLEAVCAAFLAPGDRIDAACFGVPGPVIDGRSHATNVPWEIERTALSRALGGVPVSLLNDLETTAYGMPHLKAEEMATLLAGEPRPEPANIAVIAAGTGLGEAALIATPGGYLAVASEGGHCDFAPRSPEQCGLLDFLAREFGHVSFERVLSGPGLHNIYRYLLTAMAEPEPSWLAAQMRAGDPSAAISMAALSGRDPRAVAALRLFAAIYAAEAANLALKYLALGGVMIGGGIAPKILPFLREPAFAEAFLNKGRLRETLVRIPVRVSLNEAASLIGAAWAAANGAHRA